VSIATAVATDIGSVRRVGHSMTWASVGWPPILQGDTASDIEITHRVESSGFRLLACNRSGPFPASVAVAERDWPANGSEPLWPVADTNRTIDW